MAESYVVIGGEGFLGGRIVSMLLDRYPQAAVSSFDLVQRVTTGRQAYRQVDLTDLDSLAGALEAVGATCLFHVAAAHFDASAAVCEKVNVVGTRTVLEACRRAGVKKLVFTSSAGVVFDGSDSVNIDERLPYQYTDPYNRTKAEAEALVLAANGQDGLLVCALRPAGIYGPGDRQQMPSVMQALHDGKTGIIIGENENIHDWTYVDNVVHAHLLAAERLTTVADPTKLRTRLGGVDLSLRPRPPPSSVRRPDGRWLPFETPVADGAPDPPLPATRNRLDQFYEPGSAAPEERPNLAVAGQAFFVTNGEPVFFWDQMRNMWFAYSGHDNAAKAFKLPYALAIVFGALSELFALLLGQRNPRFTRYRVRLMRANRYHSIERARLVLGYEPIVGYAEGIQRAVEVRLASLLDRNSLLRGAQWYKANEKRA